MTSVAILYSFEQQLYNFRPPTLHFHRPLDAIHRPTIGCLAVLVDVADQLSQPLAALKVGNRFLRVAFSLDGIGIAARMPQQTGTRKRVEKRSL